MKVSVIMVDGSFRENTYAAEYFAKQDLAQGEFEVIWVEFYKRANEELYTNDNIKIITLNNTKDTIYHSSFCFNEGIKQAKGELLIIPDADVIVESDFIQKALDSHQKCDGLVAYGYRYNEVAKNKLNNLEFDELKAKCIVTNPINYGGCLTVMKKWMLKINGYDQHSVFKSGFHANGLDIYTRFRNLGLVIQWDHSLKLYHPRHEFTSELAPEYESQHKLIDWRSKNLEFLPLKGIDSGLNTKITYEEVLTKLEQITPEKVKPEFLPQKSEGGILQKLKQRLLK